MTNALPVLSVARSFDERLLADSIRANARAFGYADGEATPSYAEIAKRLAHENIIALEPRVAGAPVGIMWVHRFNGRAHCHIELNPSVRGATGVRLAKIGLRWFWDNTELVKLWADCPPGRNAVLAFDKAVGFVREGTEVVPGVGPITLLSISKDKDSP